MPSPAVQPRPARGRPPIAGLRERILAGAEEVFTRRDYHEVQMDDVARACDVGKGTIYRYFPSKRALYMAIMFEGIARLRADLDRVVETDDRPVRRIERLVHGTLSHFWDRRFFFALIHQHEHKPDEDVREWFRQREALSRLVQETLEKAIAAGHLRRVNPRIATEMLLGIMRGVSRYRSPGDRLPDLVATIVDVFMRGVGTAAGRRELATPRMRRLTRA